MKIAHVMTNKLFTEMWNHLNRFDKWLPSQPDSFEISMCKYTKVYMNIEKIDIRGMKFDKVYFDEFVKLEET